MEPMYLSIQQKETGKQIKKMLKENGYTVRDIQSAMGFILNCWYNDKSSLMH
jgi:hypothetical protein